MGTKYTISDFREVMTLFIFFTYLPIKPASLSRPLEYFASISDL